MKIKEASVTGDISAETGRRGQKLYDVWGQSLPARGKGMGKGLQVGLSLAYSRKGKKVTVLHFTWSIKREEKGGGRWSHRDIIFSVPLFIICPLLPEWNLLKK